MATIQPRRPLSVGSSQWIHDENDQVAQFGAQEVEDFAFAARNEVEWLNEHMADILSKNAVNVTELLKTPGKLRGKTPKTARKRNPDEVREPLTDLFSATPRPTFNGTPQASLPKLPHTFQVLAEDPIVFVNPKKAAKMNTDSGYHGLPEDDMDIDQPNDNLQSSVGMDKSVELPSESPLPQSAIVKTQSEGRSTTERSFHSAKENLTKEMNSEEDRLNDVPPGVDSIDIAGPANDIVENPEAHGADVVANVANQVDDADKALDEELIVDESRSPSQGSSPARPLVRKSSLTFAALPAREPLTTKKSIGARVSRTSHLDQHKPPLNRGSFLDRFTGGKSLGSSKQQAVFSEQDDVGYMEHDVERPQLDREESDTYSKITKLHNKSSTQRLHERINMLGKSQPARHNKSISATAGQPPSIYTQLPNAESQSKQLQQIAGLASKAMAAQSDVEDDDDWIQPPGLQKPAPTRPPLTKSITADVMENIRGKHTIGSSDFDHARDGKQFGAELSPPQYDTARQMVVDEPAQNEKVQRSGPSSPLKHSAEVDAEFRNVLNASTTPIGSPSSKRYVDGPLSASKSKLQSIMKTARGLFSSSAGVSAQARIETMSPSSMRGPQIHQQPPTIGTSEKKTVQEVSVQNPVSNPIGRKTRSSTEKEEQRKESEAKERERLEQGRAGVQKPSNEVNEVKLQTQTKGPLAEVAQQMAKPTRHSPRRAQNQEAPKSSIDAPGDEEPAQVMGPPPSHTQGQQSQLQKPKDRRPIKPAKEAVKPKPQPVAIRVGTLSGIRLNNSALSSGLQDSLPPSQSKQPVVTKKPSNASIHSTVSNSSLKSSVNAPSSKPKALIAAERKKEQDEREAQRKLEQKREIERKRAAQQEEARRQEQQQRQEAERQRERERAAATEDPKVIAKKQAIEKRRLEMKKDQPRAPQRPVLDQVTVPHQPPAAPTLRQDTGRPRAPSRLENVPDLSRVINNQPAHNPVKPPNKRVFDPEGDDEVFKPARFQRGLSTQPNEGKRRKTEEEEPQEVRVRPTMAPPIRQSGIRQGGLKPSIFNNNYTVAPPAAHHHNATSLLKTTTAGQAYQQHVHQNAMSRPGHHPDIGKYQNGKIPFGENPNPPHPSQLHKTPLQSRLAPTAKSSPQYINGENIHLDDIPTESEDDSDSDSGSKPKPANLPAWAQSPELRQILMTQDENVDADAVFGPVQSPHMEEMFRERHHRFRSRTSSANWAGSDRLTEEEIRRDVEARQRLRREGGWTFGL